jgi:membrane fusion protein (multidrug efflux system)
MKKLPIIAAALLVLVLVGAFVYRIGQSKERNAVAKAASEKEVITSVRTATVSTKDMPQVVQITGNVKANNDIQVLPKSPGRVTNVYVDVGSIVKAGQVLATVEAVDMALRVKQAQAQLQQAQAGLEQAKVQKQTAQRGLERARALLDKGAMTQADFEGADAGAQLAAVGILGAEASVALADANLALVQKAFEDTRITTPVAGVVTRKHINIGTMAQPATAAFSVQDQSSLKMEGAVPATYVPKLALGMAVEILVDELPGRSFVGKVSRLAPTLDAETRRGAIEIALEPAEGLLPNMFGRAQISFGSSANVLVVPGTAVLSVAGQPAVYLIEKSGDATIAKMVRPKVGAKHFDEVIIEDGLSSGDVVVVSGNAGLKDGAKVSLSGI